MIYTTNAVEAIHRQFRKVTKAKPIFPDDDALRKILYLAFKDLSVRWTRPIRGWSEIFAHLCIIFDHRLQPFT
jgi:transposase-like protein